MNLQKLFEAQRILDERIIKEKGLEGQDLLPNKILALQVELGELANEWRGFKYWSNDRESRTSAFRDVWLTEDGKPPQYEHEEESMYGGEQEYNPLLEEYVDCLHFILSIGNELELTHMNWEEFQYEDNISDHFLVTMEFTSRLRFEPEENQYVYYYSVLAWLISLGFKLGFTWEQIEQAYWDKNKVNHERQTNGY